MRIFKNENIYVPQSQKSLANTFILQRLACSCITGSSNGLVGALSSAWAVGAPFRVLGEMHVALF